MPTTALVNERDNRVEMTLRPGEMQFVNNYHVLHARRAYVDDAAAGRVRWLKRLWLATDVLGPDDRPERFQGSVRWVTGASVERERERAHSRRSRRRRPSGVRARPSAQRRPGGPGRPRPAGWQHAVGAALRPIPVPRRVGGGPVSGRRRRSPVRRSARQLHRRTPRTLSRSRASGCPCGRRQRMDPRRRASERGPSRRTDRREVPVDRPGAIHELRHRGQPDGARTCAPPHAATQGAGVRGWLPRRRHHVRRPSRRERAARVGDRELQRHRRCSTVVRRSTSSRQSSSSHSRVQPGASRQIRSSSVRCDTTAIATARCSSSTR